MGIIKRILLILGLVVVLAVAAVIIVVKTYDYNQLKPEIIQAVKEATGRELVLGGDVEVSISLSPSLVVEDVSFQNASWGSRPNLMSIKRIEFEVGLLPLVSGNVEVNRLILVEPDILLETDAQGRSNVDFGSSQRAHSSKGKREKGVDEAEAEKGGSTEKQVRKDMSHLVLKEVRVENASLVVKDGQSLRTFDLKLKNFSARTENLNSTLKISLEGSYNGAQFILDGTSGSLEASMDPDVPWPLQFSGKFAGARMVLDGIIKDVQAGDGIDIKFKVATQEIEKLVSLLSGKESPIKGSASLQGRFTDPADNALRLDDLQIILADSDLSGWLLFEHGKQKVLNAELKSNRLDLRPILEPGPGKVQSAEAYDESQFRLAAAGDADNPAEDHKVFPADPLPFKALAQVKGQIKLNMAQLITPKLSAKSVELTATLKDGALALTPFSAMVGGGRMNASIGLAGSGDTGNLKVKLDLKDCNLQTILEEMGQSGKTLEGQLALEISLDGVGKSVAEIMGSLRGKTVLVLKNGKIHNSYINLAGGDLQSMLLERLNPAKKTTDYTTLECLVQGFNIKQGIAKTSALYVETDRMMINGTGQVDLKKETLNIGFEPEAKEGSGLESAKLSISLNQLVKPFTLTGTLAEPAIGLDVAKALSTIGKTAAGYGLFGASGLAAAVVSQGRDAKDACKNAEHMARFGKLPEGADTKADEAKSPDQAQQKDSQTGQEQKDPLKEVEKGIGGVLKGIFGN